MSAQPAARRARSVTLALHFGLMAVVVLWQLAQAPTAGHLTLAAVLTLPLWLPIRGLWRGVRRTYAWATLCVIPYFVLGITEVIANPGARIWAALCLLLALLLFAMLVAYLRITRPHAGAPTSAEPPP
ncbi:MAG: DUF2069 domain-containing protein [Proteobacteria bacterium]|nr:MAG: DUF2069 domain-containing protein [Pseudomonadota bacterium]